MSVEGIRAHLLRGATRFNETDVKELLDRIGSDTQTIQYLQEQGTTQVTRIRELEADVVRLQEEGRMQIRNVIRRQTARILELETELTRVNSLNHSQAAMLQEQRPYAASGRAFQETEREIRRLSEKCDALTRELTLAKTLSDLQVLTVKERDHLKSENVSLQIQNRDLRDYIATERSPLWSLSSRVVHLQTVVQEMTKERDTLKENLKSASLTMQHLQSIVNAYLVVGRS